MAFVVSRRPAAGPQQLKLHSFRIRHKRTWPLPTLGEQRVAKSSDPQSYAERGDPPAGTPTPEGFSMTTNPSERMGSHRSWAGTACISEAMGSKKSSKET